MQVSARKAHHSIDLAELIPKIEKTSLYPYVTEAVDDRERGSCLSLGEWSTADSFLATHPVWLHRAPKRVPLIVIAKLRSEKCAVRLLFSLTFQKCGQKLN